MTADPTNDSNIGAELYMPPQDHGAPSATMGIDLVNHDILDAPPFPIVCPEDLDNEFDGWPASGKSFIERMPLGQPQSIFQKEPLEKGERPLW